jgi:arginine exporter protein ArgO
LRESGSLLPFTIGVVIASAIWHSMLALLAETLGRRMAESGRRRLIRLSSVALGIVGVVLVA